MTRNRILCLFLLFTSHIILAQKSVATVFDTCTNESTIHEVLIFKWCKDGKSNIKRYIKIDSLGNVIIKNQNFLEKVDMKSFTTNIHAFIKNENLEKIAGNDNETPLAVVPEEDKQSFYIVIILTEDYVKEKKLKNKTYYSWKALGIDKHENDYSWFKYFEKKDVVLFKRFLE